MQRDMEAEITRSMLRHTVMWPCIRGAGARRRVRSEWIAAEPMTCSEDCRMVRFGRRLSKTRGNGRWKGVLHARPAERQILKECRGVLVVLLDPEAQ